MKKGKSFFLSLAITLGTGALGWLLGGSMAMKYSSLIRPPLSPLGIVFPVVWTILYVLMAVAAWRIYESRLSDKEGALRIYLEQLIFNVLWPFLYFRLG